MTTQSLCLPSSVELPELSVCGMTDQGRRRKSNQDHYLIGDLKKSMMVQQTSLEEGHSRLFGSSWGKLLVVADGMGGSLGGEEASSLAVRELERFIVNTLPWCFQLGHGPHGPGDLEYQLKLALERCDEQIRRVGEASAHLRGMGTTLTLAYVLWPRMFIVHVGDSRAYLLRGDEIRQLTTDHTMAQKLLEEGALEERYVSRSPLSHVLWNSLGSKSSGVVPEASTIELSLNDTVVLCSDGLTREVPDDDILRIVRASEGPACACEALVAEANARGGRDNITVVVAREAGE
jgi:protein phosphatase